MQNLKLNTIQVADSSSVFQQECTRYYPLHQHNRMPSVCFGGFAFGPLHRADVTNSWVGPDAWRTTGYEWTESYWLTELGIRTAPWLEETEE